MITSQSVSQSVISRSRPALTPPPALNYISSGSNVLPECTTSLRTQRPEALNAPASPSQSECRDCPTRSELTHVTRRPQSHVMHSCHCHRPEKARGQRARTRVGWASAPKRGGAAAACGIATCARARGPRSRASGAWRASGQSRPRSSPQSRRAAGRHASCRPPR